MSASSRRTAWVLLFVMGLGVFAPLVSVVQARPSSAYAVWLADRAALSSHPELEAALAQAASSRHDSIEGFVQEFVAALEASGQLGSALEAFAGPIATATNADELVDLILSGLRSLSPKEPTHTARLTPAEGAGLLVAPRPLPGSRSGSLDAPEAAEAEWTEVRGPHPADGLRTSIQSRGP